MHGYLISQFASFTFKPARTASAAENHALRVETRLHPLQVRLASCRWCVTRDEWVQGGATCRRASAPRWRRPGDAIDLSQCIQETPGSGFSPMYYPEGWTMYASEAVKKEVRVPVLNTHVLRDPDHCETLLREGKTDMVGLSRQLLADPYWPLKAKYGKRDEIRKCISCLEGCWQEAHMAKHDLRCAVNPACGEESFARMKRTEKPVSIGIVGGGPAGLEAARHAALRGHRVTLFEKTGELGGAILLLHGAGQGEDEVVRRLGPRVMKDANITVRLSHAPTLEEMKGFHIVLNATGARSFVPDMVRGSEHVIPFEEVIACPKVKCAFHPQDGRRPRKLGERVLLWGDHYAAVDTAQYLASIGKRVTILTRAAHLGAEVETVHMYVLRKRFALQEAEALDGKPWKYPVEVIQNATVAEAGEGYALIQDRQFQMRRLEVDAVVTCHTRPDTAFLEEMRAAGIPAANAGDSDRVRNLHHAVLAGAVFGRDVDAGALMNPNHAPVGDLPLEIAAQFGL